MIGGLLHLNSTMLVSLATYTDLAVASPIDQNGWFSRVVLYKRGSLGRAGSSHPNCTLLRAWWPEDRAFDSR